MISDLSFRQTTSSRRLRAETAGTGGESQRLRHLRLPRCSATVRGMREQDCLLRGVSHGLSQEEGETAHGRGGRELVEGALHLHARAGLRNRYSTWRTATGLHDSAFLKNFVAEREDAPRPDCSESLCYVLNTAQEREVIDRVVNVVHRLDGNVLAYKHDGLFLEFEGDLGLLRNEIKSARTPWNSRTPRTSGGGSATLTSRRHSHPRQRIMGFSPRS